MKSIKIALAGNPNSGKTTLLNAMTGARHQVGNWPGVTVEKKEGHIRWNGISVTLVDLPGVYSLSPYTIEERIARTYLIDEKPDLIINLVDACSLERNLYLTTQLMELKIPMIVAVNMMDEAEKNGFNINTDLLEKALNLPFHPISAIEKRGIDSLLNRAFDVISDEQKYNPIQIDYGTDLERMIQKLEMEIEHHGISANIPARWIAVKSLEKDDLLRDSIGFEGVKLLKLDRDYTDEVANAKYRCINKILKDALQQNETSAYALSDKIDRVLLNQWLGIPIFLLIMALIFKLTFDVGGIFADILEAFFSGILSEYVRMAFESIGISAWMINLVVDGIIGGVGGVIVFLPNLVILFIAISLLEDSGYMARAAFLLDGWMQKVGLSGKTFIPLVIGFGCNVPGIMAARTLENEKDRLIAILINPFMSCGARFPVYVLIASAFFPGNEAIVTYSLYLLGIVVALFVAWAFRKTIFKGEEAHFIMELPPYRLPKPKFLFFHVWDRTKGYLVKAGTVIFGASVVLWLLLNYGPNGAAPITESFGALFGKVTAPIFSPLGFGTWQASLSLFSGIVAKEIVVANMSIIYGVGAESGAQVFRQALSVDFSPLTAYTFMVFVLLYTPCVGVVGAIKRETNSWKWTAFSVVFQFALAWFIAFVIYQLAGIVYSIF